MFLTTSNPLTITFKIRQRCRWKSRKFDYYQSSDLILARNLVLVVDNWVKKMSSFLEKCEEFFGSRNFYEVLQIKPDAAQKDVKKAYHKLSLQVHPDRVEEKHKDNATEKFKVLGRIYSVLQDKEKRKIYDESGDFDEDGNNDFDWMNFWKRIFRPISRKDIQDYEKQYIGSETEKRDLKKAYVNTKGNMSAILELVQFANCDSEPRFIEIVRKMVDDGEVEEYKRFFNESARSKQRRRKEEDEEKVKASSVDLDELEKQINERSKERSSNFFNFINNLEETYGKTKKPKRLAVENKPATKTKKQKTRK